MKKPASISRLLAIYLVCTGAFVLLTIVGCSSSLTASINKPTAATSSTAPTAAPTATPLATTTTTPVLVTATPPAPAPTDTPTPTSIPLPTALATLPAPIANTLLLYTTPVDDPSGQAYWAFRTLPPLPGPDPAAFDTLYGSNQGEGPARYFRDFRPQLSPDSRYILVPGLVSYPEYGVVGTGTWLIDLTTGAARELLPDGVIAT